MVLPDTLNIEIELKLIHLTGKLYQLKTESNLI